jgi:uncharacterized coiled-coil DUF342 family protein
MVIAFAEQLAQLKRQFLELLEKDLELRYTIAGYLGLSEILKRLDSIEESIRKLWENQNRLWENQNKLWESQNKMWEEIKALRESQNRLWEGQNRLWEEVRALREGQNRLWEGQNRLWEEVRALREGQNKLWEGQNRLWEEVRALREGQNKLWESQNRLWESQNKLWEEVRELRKDIRDVKITMERITLSLEEEARGFIAYRLKRELGVEVELDRVFVDTLEINVYGAVGDLCVVGEATVRLGPSLVEGLLKKVEVLRMKRPDLLKKKLLKVIYTDVAVPQALQLAKEKGVWVLRWDRNLTPIKVEETLG